MLFEKAIIVYVLIGILAGGPQASKPLKSDLREPRKCQIF